MKGILGLLRMSSRNNKPQQDHSDSVFFSTAFANQGVDPAMLVPWEARAVEVGAKRLPASKGGKLLQALWSKDKYMAHLDQDAVRRMENFFEFAQVPPNRDLIRQDEYGNFMIVLLSGTIAVDILGEMSLLDSGIRFSACTTLTDCEVAVLSAEGMDDMMVKDPQLAASLVALLARKLSLRLRAVSARLSENQK
jgi:CRP/FNR family cyclic AMP-dependent transcriptional regulator